MIEVSLSLIDESPHHRRSRWGDMEALAASIRANGVESAGKARLMPTGRYELVFGHRRFRGSGMAGRETMPIVVVEMSTIEVIAAQVRENSDREDPSPIDEGASYELLEREHGLTIAEIAERVNTSPTTVAARLRLVKLIAPLRALLDGDRMPIAAGQLLAMQESDVQEQCADDIARLHPVGWIEKRDVERVLERHVRRLDRAPFSPSDATLTSAGACLACSRNTAVQRDLFDAGDGPGVCTLPPCFVAKTDESWNRIVAKGEAEGIRVLTTDEAHLAIDGRQVRPKSPWVDADTTLSIETQETWSERERALAASDVNGVGFDPKKLAYARVGDAFFRLIDAPYAAGFIANEYPERARQLRGELDPAVIESKEEKAKKKAKALVELQARGKGSAAVVEMMSADLGVEQMTKVLRLDVLMALDAVKSETQHEVARRRELPLDEAHGREISPREAISRAAADMDAKQLGALLTELLLTCQLRDEQSLAKPAHELLGLAGVNMKKLEKQIANEGKGVTTRKRKSLPVVVDAVATPAEGEAAE